MERAEALKQQLVDLLLRTGQEHHRAFEAVDGDDPDWPIWYADRLAEPLGRLLGIDLSRSRLVYCLTHAEDERLARAADAEWAPYYADYFIECLAVSSTSSKDTLALYYLETCGFCRRVRAAIDRLGLDVELRDIHGDSKHWDDLIAARGRGTVPVLKIDAEDGTERWMPESADIIRYLDQTYG